MILVLFLKWFFEKSTQNTDVFWYGGAFALLADAFVINVLVNILRTLQ